jgi:hypothetical protein
MAIIQLDGLRIHKRSVERLGCIKGCLDYLGHDVSLSWLYGGTGHAFVISLDPGVDVSSPDSWNHQPQFDLGPNLGYRIDGFWAWKPDNEESFPDKQREAWEFVRANIDRGVPCFGFELKAYYGGFWVIYGYDDGTGKEPAGYYYSGWEEGGPLPWNKLGDQFIPKLEVRSVVLCDPATDTQTVRTGLQYALKHAQNPPEWIDEQAQSGSAAWAYWAEALESGEAKRDHHTYNAQLWLECRQAAVEFFAEAKQRLPGRCDSGFDRATEQYAAVCAQLETVIALHPPREKPNWGPDSTFSSAEAAALVRQAGEADEAGLSCLSEIVDAL